MKMCIYSPPIGNDEDESMQVEIKPNHHNSDGTAITVCSIFQHWYVAFQVSAISAIVVSVVVMCGGNTSKGRVKVIWSVSRQGGQRQREIFFFCTDKYSRVSRSFDRRSPTEWNLFTYYLIFFFPFFWRAKTYTPQTYIIYIADTSTSARALDNGPK